MARPMQVSRYWRHFREKYRLIGGKCENGHVFFPYRQVCPVCGSKNVEEYEFSGKGKVLTWTIVRNPPSGFEYYKPYPLALVQLEEGPVVLAQLTDVDPEEIHEGMEVEVVTRKVREFEEDGIILYGYKFRPVLR
ncbi:Zn-ribbon domain-containing OB-fold protein [Thermococcus nautili]|uniref:Putative nucleic-acid-binding protein containing a Zn-ribbon n=1 Tax=Thermococcus nautili TaxID=195522 RepID=W8P3I1_9EURY|nr:Zn-ribbon domain-containing OB-fold protein [Thermococcus nautili]AHL23331.1 putative nucleic-acid-binding protein containing a Zn-ribbon [Thermococcus nautili]